MQFIRHWQSYSSHSKHPALALTIGNFDGVHLGHQSLLTELVSQAKRQGLAPAVMSFTPHPAEYFDAIDGTARAPDRIQTLRDKALYLANAGIETLVLCPFNAQLAHLAPQDFVEHVLVQSLNVKHLLIGDDFRFGAKRAGDFALLQSLASRYGYGLQAMSSVVQDGTRVSSSTVRRALGNDDVGLATKLLGHNYSISGHVVHGAKLGRELGVPTLNIRFGHPRPAITGIFVVTVEGLASQLLRGVASFGVRPSLDPNDANQGRVLLEVHVFDYPQKMDAYGKIVRVNLLHKLHDEIKYDSLETLKKGIANDIANAHHYFAKQ